MKNARIIAAYSDVHMALGHVGLSAIAKKNKINVDSMESGEIILFLSSGRDKLKMLGPKGIVLGYVKMPKGRTLPLEAVQFIPQTFSPDGKIDLDKAISAYVTEKLTKK